MVAVGNTDSGDGADNRLLWLAAIPFARRANCDPVCFGRPGARLGFSQKAALPVTIAGHNDNYFFLVLW